MEAIIGLANLHVFWLSCYGYGAFYPYSVVTIEQRIKPDT